MLQTNFALLWISYFLILLVLAILMLFVERKFIAIAQKRLGISFLGRNGWAHLPADLVKFWLKSSSRHHGAWNTASLGVISAILALLIWVLGVGIFYPTDAMSAISDFWDFQILAYLVYSNISTILMLAVITALRSKYALLASARLVIVIISLEIFFSLVWFVVYLHSGAFTLDEASGLLSGEPILWAIPSLAIWLTLFIFFESKRAPFDHSEAESELVAGHLVEFGGRALFLFYICEYLHLVGAVLIFTILIFGAGQLIPIVGYSISLGPAGLLG